VNAGRGLRANHRRCADVSLPATNDLFTSATVSNADSATGCASNSGASLHSSQVGGTGTKTRGTKTIGHAQPGAIGNWSLETDPAHDAGTGPSRRSAITGLSRTESRLAISQCRRELGSDWLCR
jgi:hypothetical protein